MVDWLVEVELHPGVFLERSMQHSGNKQMFKYGTFTSG